MKITGLKINNNISVQNKVAEVKEFLNEHYDIRVNEFDPSKSDIKPKTRKFENPVTFDDISLHLIEQGIAVSDNILRKILRSPNQIKTYNPIKEYFESLKGKYQGVSHIDLLMSHLRMREFPGKKKDYYQHRMYRYMKKWFVATTACALGLHPNDVAMGLVHADEGIGKTFFFKFIVPPSLQNLIADPNEDGKFNLQESFARNFLVYFDELVGLTRRNTEEFKKVMSADEIDVYFPREPYPVRRNRIASGCFSSNKTPEKGGFLSSSMGYRRWLIFELESINQDFSKKVNVDQLWAEALLLIEQDFDYKWTINDWTEFRDHNKMYMEETTSMKYIKMYFEHPQNGEGTWLQPKEIFNLLVATRKLTKEDQSKVSDVKIGEALSALSFTHKGVRRPDGTRRCYYVKKTF